MDRLTREALLACDYFAEYHRALLAVARKTTASKVKSRKLNELYERLAKQVGLVNEIRRQIAERN